MADLTAENSQDLLEDYATSRVPDDRTVNGFRVGGVNGGLVFAIPGLVTGIELGSALGMQRSIYAFLIGGMILAVLGAITGIVGRENRLTACITMKFVFGNHGANLLACMFVVALMGWYGVNIDLFGKALQEICLQLFKVSPNIMVLEVGAGILITLSTFAGFKMLERLSTIIVPIMALAVIYMLYASLNYDGVSKEVLATPGFSFGEAISIVVGGFILSVVLMPDFSRFAKSRTDATIGSFYPFLGLSSFVYLVSAYAGIVVGQSDVLVVQLALGMGMFALVLLVMASWITNAVNLYSAALGANSIIQNKNIWKIIICGGIVGTGVASLNILDQLTEFLYGLSIIFTPVAGVYAADFFIVRKSKIYDIERIDDLPAIKWGAFIAWGAGMAASMLSINGTLTLTGIEVLDALLVTVPVYLLIVKLFDRSLK